MLAREPDRTGRRSGVAIAGNCGSRVRQRPGELEVDPEVEVAEPLEGELEDPLRGELTAGVRAGSLDPIDDPLDVPRRHGSLVGRAQKRRPELGPVEPLSVAVALADEERLRLGALEGGEAMSLRADPAATD